MMLAFCVDNIHVILVGELHVVLQQEAPVILRYRQLVVQCAGNLSCLIHLAFLVGLQL